MLVSPDFSGGNPEIDINLRIFILVNGWFKSRLHTLRKRS